jgi:hypothetical protein
LAAAERRIPDLARLQAIQVQLAIQAAAWHAYDAEVAREDEFVAAAILADQSAAAAEPHSRQHPDWLPPGMRPSAIPCTQPPYRAQRARLLTVASTAALRAARLQGLLSPAASIAHPTVHPAVPAHPGSAPGAAPTSCTCACHHQPVPATAPVNATPDNTVAFCGIPDQPSSRPTPTQNTVASCGTLAQPSSRLTPAPTQNTVAFCGTPAATVASSPSRDPSPHPVAHATSHSRHHHHSPTVTFLPRPSDRVSAVSLQSAKADFAAERP